MYKERLEQLGVESSNIRSNRLKDQLMTQMPELESYRKGRDVMITFREDLGPVLSQASVVLLFFLKQTAYCVSI